MIRPALRASADSPVGRLLARLEGARRSGRDWSARCPAHDDRRASLSLREGDDGRALLKCHAGCDPGAIATALGLELRDLFPLQAGNGNGQKPEITSTYDYVDEEGRLLYQVVRFIPKDFRQRKPDGRGGWVWSLGDVQRVLYRLPELLEAVALDKLVHIVEGEKDVHAIAAVGGVATTNAGGAGKWRPEYSEALQGARVRIVADRDDPGRKHAHQVAEALAGVAWEVEIVQARTGKDAADHLAAGHGLEDFDPLQEDGEEGAGAEPLFDPAAVRFGRFLESDPPERRMIVPEFLPLDVVALLASMGGAGKSVLLYQLGISVATGAPILGMPLREVGSALSLAAEDDEHELHRRGRRLLEHTEGEHYIDRRALSERLHVVSRVAEDNLLTAGRDGEVSRTRLVDQLIAAARRIPDLKLITIDPVSRFRGGRANAEEDTTAFVTALEAIRAATGATVLAAVHVNKASIRDGDEPDQSAVRGSSALVDGVRWCATMQRLRRDAAADYGIPDDEASHYVRLDLVKSNYTAPWPGMWLRRLPGGVLVPADLRRNTEARKEARADERYQEILGRVQDLLRAKGPLSANAIETKHAGQLGTLGAGQLAVRSVLQRAVDSGDLVQRDREGRGGGSVLDLPGGDT